MISAVSGLLSAGFLALVLIGQVAGAAPVAPAREAPQFQAYIFWAYGLACLFLFALTAWLIARARRLEEEMRYLKERFEKAHAEAARGLEER